MIGECSVVVGQRGRKEGRGEEGQVKEAKRRGRVRGGRQLKVNEPYSPSGKGRGACQ